MLVNSLQSKEAMFTNGPLSEECRWYGEEEEGVKLLLRGILDKKSSNGIPSIWEGRGGLLESTNV